ncbi:MAG: TIGR03016 family PEP-CTERM system-associated outer membrane protein [Roseococcus sp.]|nr:TIGR03016 family PEP-CTERM system-associated outer membrane protein [Roseococcus sp.]
MRPEPLGFVLMLPAAALAQAPPFALETSPRAGVVAPDTSPAAMSDPSLGIAPEAGAPASAGFDAPLARSPAPGAPALGNSALIPTAQGFPFNAAGRPADTTARRFTVTPSIAAQVLGTDNLQQTATGARSELITTLTPGLAITADTARLQGLLNYTPALQLYGADPSRPQVLQRFNGQFLATIVPEAIFVDLRGAAATQAANGGFAPQSTPSLGRDGLVQTIAYQIAPYWMHRFGDLATVQAGYAFQSVQQNLVGGGPALSQTTAPTGFANDHFTANALYGVARTGERFGPLGLEARLFSTDYDGTGVLQNAYRRSATVEGRYFINRRFALLAEGGYEMQRYSGTPRFELSEPIWSVGARVALSPDSGFTLRYVHRGGFSSPALDSVFAIGGRTRIFASYSERLTTGAQRAADFLNLTTLDALGNPVDSLTGAPASQPFADSFLGAQGSLLRIRRASATITQTWPRDVFALTLASERQRPVTVASGATALEQTGNSLTLTWSHALTPVTTAIASLQYGRLERQGQPTGDVYGGTVSLVTQLAPGLSAYAQYGLTNRGDQFGGGRAIQNVVVIGLRQSF